MSNLNKIFLEYLPLNVAIDQYILTYDTKRFENVAKLCTKGKPKCINKKSKASQSNRSH